MKLLLALLCFKEKKIGVMVKKTLCDLASAFNTFSATFLYSSTKKCGGYVNGGYIIRSPTATQCLRSWIIPNRMEIYLRGITSEVPDHCNKVNVSLKGVRRFGEGGRSQCILHYTVIY